MTADVSGVSIFEVGTIPAIPITASVQVPNGTGVEVVAGSFNVAPDEVVAGTDFDTLIWNVTLTPGSESQTLTWDLNVTDLQPGESRLASLDTAIEFSYRLAPAGTVGGDYPFTVTAASITDVSITAYVNGLLSGSDIGVEVEVTTLSHLAIWHRRWPAPRD